MSLRQDAALVLGLAGFLLGGTGAYLGWAALRQADATRADVFDTVEHDGEMIENLAARVEDLRRSVQGEGDPEALGGVAQEIALLRRDVLEANRRVGGVREEEQQLREKVRELIGRLDAVTKELRAQQLRVEELERRPVAPPVPDAGQDLVPRSPSDDE